jgi:hypothetical protein
MLMLFVKLRFTRTWMSCSRCKAKLRQLTKLLYCYFPAAAG